MFSELGCFINRSVLRPKVLFIKKCAHFLTEIPSGGGSGKVVRDNHSGTPFVLRGPPSSSNQAVGTALFGHQHDHQSAGIQTGPVSSEVQRPATKPAAVGSHHFQLASASHFKGVNPFSPSLSGRARSMDGLSEQKAMEQNRQAHSAPIVPAMPGDSYFHYPSKRSLQFYLPTIKVKILGQLLKNSLDGV